MLNAGNPTRGAVVFQKGLVLVVGLLAHDVDAVIECLTLYCICSKLLFLLANLVVLLERKKILHQTSS